MATCENFGIDALTRLTEPVSSVDTEITINSPIGFPDAPFRLRINDEYMLVTSVLGNVWTVTRGLEGSTPQDHGIGDLVGNVVTVAGLFNIMACYSLTGTRADRPVSDPELPGRIYFTESPGWYAFRDDGSSWESYGILFQLFEPEETGFSWVNQGAATTSTVDGGVVLTTPGVSGDNLRLRIESAGMTPYNVVGGFIPTLYPADQTSVGLVFRESGTERIIFFRLMYDTTSSIAKNDMVLAVDKYTDPNTFDSNYITISAAIFKTSLIWLQVEDDGVDLIFNYSNDGYNYRTLTSQARDDFFTTGPDEVGYAVNTNTTDGGATLTLLSYQNF